jgi:tetratricopeptide (TPR) repeat protein
MKTQKYPTWIALLIVCASAVAPSCSAQAAPAKTAAEKAAEARKAFYEGETLARQMKYKKAIACFDQAIRLNAKDSRFYYNRGLAYYDLRESGLAIIDYNRAIHLNPNDADFFYNRGLAYHDQNHDESALNDYTEAVRLKPNSPRPTTTVASPITG